MAWDDRVIKHPALVSKPGPCLCPSSSLRSGFARALRIAALTWFGIRSPSPTPVRLPNEENNLSVKSQHPRGARHHRYDVS